MPPNTTILLLFLVILAFCLSDNGVYAFGAGNIPSFAFMEGRAFRHGDIEDILSDLIKRGAGGFALAGILSKGSKFNGLDVKRVYFGNWLRDYSQAVDIASLKKVPLQTIINLCMVLGFLAHGYATEEFEVTPQRLGCYLPTEHIDNPKGYGEGEDARKYHAGLRGPVDPRELEFDSRTGMKNYIANEDGPWDTSKALVRRTLEQCIHLGRKYRSSNQKPDQYEAFRLLGQAMHTLEDFPAHSNFCELTLVSMGHRDVFVHVGDNVRVQASGGKWVAPIVTGSFGSSDFIHSLLGEASDHLSEASVTDLNRELNKARSKSIEQSTRSGPGGAPSDPSSNLRELFTSIPGGGSDLSRDMESIERLRAGPAAGGKRPEDMTPQELHSVLWQVLTFRDSVAKKISQTIEKIPGLGALIDKIMDGISVFVFTTLEPFLKPLLKTATSSLAVVSGEVIDTHDQYEVFNDPRASDPTHSFLSKDHFNLILNEPAGKVARVIVQNTVTLVVKAWDNPAENIHTVTEEILQCLFHPDFHDRNSKVQREMIQVMHDWFQGLGKKQNSILARLSKNAVRNHENTRLAGEGGTAASQGSYAAAQGHQFQNTLVGYASGVPGAQTVFSATGFGTGTTKSGGGGEAAAFLGSGSAAVASASSYGQGHGSSQGHYRPPPGPPPPSGGASSSSYAGMHATSAQTPTTPHRDGYAPSYAQPPPVSHGVSPPPSFPGGPSGGGNTGPSFQQPHQHQLGGGGGPPSFPMGFPGSEPTSLGGFSAPAHSSFAPPPGPPPAFPGGQSDFSRAPGLGGFGFPDPGSGGPSVGGFREGPHHGSGAPEFPNVFGGGGSGSGPGPGPLHGQPGHGQGGYGQGGYGQRPPGWQ